MNQKAEVEIRRSADLSLKWTAKVKNFSDLFSQFRATRDGAFLVHVRGNHQINKVNDVCVEVYSQDGLKVSYRVSDFLEALPPFKRAMSLSIDPQYEWIKSIDPSVSQERLGITLFDGRYVQVSIKKHAVAQHDNP